MTKIDLPYVQKFRDRHGKLRHYFRKSGAKRMILPGLPGSREFMAAYAAALDAAKTHQTSGVGVSKPGSLSAGLVQYYQSYDFLRLKPITQGSYKNILERFRRDYGHNALADLNAAQIRSFLDERAHVPGAARNFLKRLKRFLEFAVERGLIPSNPAQGVKAPKVPSGGFAAWTDDDITKFEARYATGSPQRLALALLLYTGQRRSDVVLLGWKDVKGDTIHVLQEKGPIERPRTHLAIPIHSLLKTELSHSPPDQPTFLITAYGKPRTKDGFTQWFTDSAKRAGLIDRSAHGLRKAAARKMAEAGCSASQIAAVTGHTTLNEVSHYTKSVDQERLARQAITAWSSPKRSLVVSTLQRDAVKPTKIPIKNRYIKGGLVGPEGLEPPTRPL